MSDFLPRQIAASETEPPILPYFLSGASTRVWKLGWDQSSHSGGIKEAAKMNPHWEGLEKK